MIDTRTAEISKHNTYFILADGLQRSAGPPSVFIVAEFPFVHHVQTSPGQVVGIQTCFASRVRTKCKCYVTENESEFNSANMCRTFSNIGQQLARRHRITNSNDSNLNSAVTKRFDVPRKFVVPWIYFLIAPILLRTARVINLINK